MAAGKISFQAKIMMGFSKGGTWRCVAPRSIAAASGGTGEWYHTTPGNHFCDGFLAHPVGSGGIRPSTPLSAWRSDVTYLRPGRSE